MNNRLRILLFAYHHAGMDAIRLLRGAGHTIVECFSHATSETWVPDVATECARLGIPCSVSNPADADVARCQEHNIDLVLSVYYRNRISQPILNLPRIGAFNVHPSPLPRYRGCFSVPWALTDQQRAWAVTVHAMNESFDDGGILCRRDVEVLETDNAYNLFMRCAANAAGAMVDAAEQLSAGTAKIVPQNPEHATYFPRQVPMGGAIDWHQSGEQLAAFVRAMDFGRATTRGYEHLYPPALARLDGHDLGIWNVSLRHTDRSGATPGMITRCDSNELCVQTRSGQLLITGMCDSTGKDVSPGEFLMSLGARCARSLDVTHRWPGRRSAKLEVLNVA